MNDDGYSFLNDPWGQAAAVGAATLVPVREYPGWLKATLGWGSAIGVTAMVATPGATSKVVRKLNEVSGDDLEPLGETRIRPATRAVLAAAAGAAVYGGWRFSVWSDTAAERLLRRLKVPAPRLVMAAAAGYATWWQVRQANQRAAAERIGRART